MTVSSYEKCFIPKNCDGTFLVIKLRKRRSIRRNWRLRPISTETWDLGWLGWYGAIIALILTLRKEKKKLKKRLRRRQISPICQIENCDPWIWVWRLVQFNHCAWKLWLVEETFSKNILKKKLYWSFMQRFPYYLCYVQTDATTPNNVGSCCVRLHGAKSLTGFKFCAITIPNNTQQQTCNRVCKRTPLVTSNNDVASVSTGLYTVMARVHVDRSFAVAPKTSV